MPKHKEETKTPEAPADATDAKAVQKWSVWTQGPKDAKETKRKFAITTPGQVRDYKHFVTKRKFQRFEAVEQEDEDAAVNSVAGGGVDMAPNASGTKVFMKRRRLEVDGRSKAYRAATKRIKERNAKAQERDAVKKLSQFGVTNNPFQREQKEMDNNKYLETKDGSIEQAAVDSVSTDKPYNPNSDRPTLTLPKNRYLDTKEESIEWSVMKAISENDNHPPGSPPKKPYKLPRQLKDPKKEKMVGTKSGTKVVDRGDPKYKNAPEHESVEVPEASGEIKAKKLRLKRRYKSWDKASKGEPEKGEEGGEKGDIEAGPKEKEKSSETEKGVDRVNPKELKGRFKDRKDKDIDNDGKVNKLDRFLHKRRKAASKDKENQDEDPVGKVKEGKEQHPGQKKGSAKLKKGWKMTQSGEPYFKPNSNNPTRDKKEEVEVDETTVGWGKSKQIKKMKFGKGTGGVKPGKLSDLEKHNKDLRAKKEGTEGDALVKAVANSPKQQALKKKQMLGITPAGKKAVKKGDHKLSITPKGKAAIKDDVNLDELSKKTMGSYVKKASADAAQGGVELGRSAAKQGGQTDDDIRKHGGKIVKRQIGISKAVDKLSKESKEVDAGERDMGSDEYANYVKTLTPGEKAETDVINRDARKAEVKQKKEKIVQNHQATRIDDEYKLDEVLPGMFGSRPGQGSKRVIQKPKKSITQDKRIGANKPGSVAMKKEETDMSMVNAVKEALKKK